MGIGTVPTIIIVVIILLAIGLFIFLRLYNEKYENFVLSKSQAIKNLEEINSSFTFNKIENLDMTHSYDNEKFYNEISCKDYLTYQLVFMQKRVNTAMKNTLENKIQKDLYASAIKKKCVLGRFGSEMLRNQNKVYFKEREIFDKLVLRPKIDFSISVRLTRTDINGKHLCSKSKNFSCKEIKDIMYRLNHKDGSFYLNRDIWDSICRVERGKVTNRMRFAIYNRDHNRCVKCGSRYNLEIDHIYPISKGGKSTMDNLQTLCHRCNYEKGDQIE